jgi:hypothetical protein
MLYENTEKSKHLSIHVNPVSHLTGMANSADAKSLALAAGFDSQLRPGVA